MTWAVRKRWPSRPSATSSRGSSPRRPSSSSTPRCTPTGVGLDSLEAAELSALLEDEVGSDPFTSDEMPQTLRDILALLRRGTSRGLIELLRRVADEDPQRAAILTHDRTVSYGELVRRR